MPNNIPNTMEAVLLTGHGGLEKLEYRFDVAVPTPAVNEVLIRVAAADINNTDINTRTAWYSKSVTSDTNAVGESSFESVDDTDGSWSGVPLAFLRIQGADCCGIIAAVGENVIAGRIGERVMVRPIQATAADLATGNFDCRTYGSECDGGFAQYAIAFSADALSVQSDMSDVELASFPCAYTTAEGMLDIASIGAESVLVTGASGGVGSAAVQLAKCRGATVIAMASSSKAADKVIDRDSDIVVALGESSIDVVVDLVAGSQWPHLLDVLKRGDRYVTAGAIAGPIVELDVRTLYLKDLSLFGSTFQDAGIFEKIIAYIERKEIRPVVAKSYPLKDIAQAQQDFLSKKYTGKLVLVLPQAVTNEN